MTANIGNTVKVLYQRIAERNIAFDSERNAKQLEFTIGGGQVISGFEEAVIGMREGEEKTVSIPPEKAFGKRSEKNIINVRRGRLPRTLELEIGKRLVMRTNRGRRAIFTVSGLSDTSVTLDANHTLSGKDLTFRIFLKEVLQ